MPKIDITNIRMQAGRMMMMILAGCFIALSAASAQGNVFLTTNIIPAGKGQVQLSPEQPLDGYTPGTIVTVTAVDSDPCYQFSHWTGDLTGSNPVSTVTMDRNKTVSANFAPGIFGVTVSSLSQFIISGAPPADQRLVITSTGGNCFTWSLETTEDWIFISKNSGTGNDSVTVNIISSKVPCQGTHVGFIRLRSVSMNPQEILIPVLLRVGAEEVTASVTGSPTAISCQTYAPDIITVTITNNSASQIIFTTPPNFGEGFVLKNPDVFPMVLEDNGKAPLNQKELFIRFEPTPNQAGSIASQIKMVANNCGREVYFELTATRIKPTATVNVNELDFGIINNCVIDPLPVRTIVLQNLYVENAQLWYKKPQGFTLITAPNAVAGGSEATIEIRAERDGPAVIDSILEIEVDYNICSEFIRIHLTGSRQSPSFYAETVTGSHAFTSVEFDTTCLGQQNTRTVRVVNDGNSPLNFSVSLSSTEYFSSDASSFSLNPGADHILTLTFSPQIAGDFSSLLTINADQCDLSESTTLYGHTFNEVLLSTTITPSQIILANCEIDSSFTLVINNTDTQPATFTGPPSTLPVGFEWDPSITYPVVIPPSGQFTATIYFRPPVGVGGVFGDTANWYGDPCGTRASFVLSGQRILPTYTVNPTDIDLGMIVICDTTAQNVSQDFTFNNTSTIPMTLTPQTLPQGLTLMYNGGAFPPAGLIVAAGATETITVKAADRDSGTVDVKLIMDVAAGQAGACNSSFTINVTGTWYKPSFEVAVETPGSDVFSALCIGESETRRFIVRNTGNMQIQIQSSGFGAGSDFSLSGGSFNQVLSPAAQLYFDVVFSPTVRGIRTGFIVFTDNACNTTDTLFVSGTGVQPAFVVDSIIPSMPMNILSCEPDANRKITVIVANTSSDSLTLRDIFLPTGFAIDSSTTFPMRIEGNTTANVYLKFTGADIGSYGGAATLFANECNLSVDFNLQVIVSSSSYTLSNTAFDFGNIRVCPSGSVFPEDQNNLTQSIEIANTGTSAMDVSATFSIPHSNVTMTSPATNPFSLAPGQTKYITLALNQPLTGVTTVNAELRVVSSRDTLCNTPPTLIPITATIQRVGFAFTQDSIQSAANLDDDSVTIWATVQNTGEGPVTLNLALNGAANFSIAGDPTITLEIGETDSVRIRFIPTTTGSMSTVLTATNPVCQTTDQVRIRVTILQSRIVIMGNSMPGTRLTLTARPGDRIDIPVYLRDSLKLNNGEVPVESGQIDLYLDMQFNVYDLAPESITPINVDAASFERTAPNTIRIRLSDSSFNAGLLARIQTEVLLGTAATTEWEFLNPSFDPLVAFIDLDNNVTGTLNVQPRNGFRTRRDLGIPWIESPVPNPVTASSAQQPTVEYNITQDSRVEIGLYNELGIQVRSLHSGWMPKGVHQVAIDAATLPNGMYHVVLKAGSFNASQKLILGR